MIARIAAVIALLVAVAGLRTPSVAAAPADASSNGIDFSSSVSSGNQPSDPRVEFGGNTHTVWASFGLHDADQNAKVSYLVRANGEDYKWGKLDASGNGRHAFPITKRSGSGNLPGAAYDVRVYVNDAEVAHGGFGVKGRGGLDHDGQ